MEIAFHSLFSILTTWLLISSTFGYIALQPGYDQSGQFKHLSPNIQTNRYYPAVQPAQTNYQPYNAQFGQMPSNFQSMSPPVWPNPWMMNYRLHQPFGHPGLPRSTPIAPATSNQFSPSSLDAELQRNKELQEKLNIYMSGFSPSNSAQSLQQPMTPIDPRPNVPYYPLYPPYPPSFNNLRSYRSLPIIQSQGYQIIKLRDLQNAQQPSAWSNSVASRLDSGLNSQTYNSQHHDVATNSSINLSQLESNTRELSKKVDDDIVGSPLKIYRSQSLFYEQHHPVEMVNIPDGFYASNDTSKSKDNMDIMKKNFSKTSDQMISNTSNEQENFPQDSSQRIEQVSNVQDYTNKPIKDFSKEVKSQSVYQHSPRKDSSILSDAKGNDRPITKIQYPLYNERINYNPPQVFGVEGSHQSSYIPQKGFINLQTSKIPSAFNYQSNIDNDDYNSYKNYPQINVSPKFPFTTYNIDNPYNTATNTISKDQALWQSSGLLNSRYAPNWNNFGTEYYQQ